jgi:ADP-ribosylglycohydrolase/alpha-beta hydrolase superfamily lysophospholipase
MNPREAAVWGSFIGDALALGPHWIYKTPQIQKTLGRVEHYVDPISEYHPKRKAGEFTHYGDQTLWLLQSLDQHRGFHADRFVRTWHSAWKDHDAYLDEATQSTLENLESGTSWELSGSESDDLAGAARIAPLLAAPNLHNESDRVEAARLQTRLTHAAPSVVDAAEFFIRLTERVLAGESMDDALAAIENHTYEGLPAKEWADKARDLLAKPTLQSVVQLGQTCHAHHAFPATLYLLMKYEDDFETAMVENVMAGGDSAARGMILGMVLGASLGEGGLPQRWIEELEARADIEERLKRLSEPDQARSLKVTFPNSDGLQLAARLELPAGSPRGMALFAHCFTCSKDIAAASRIGRHLSERGLAVLRFDFTGLGNSDGDFANTSFRSNVDDLVAAAEYLGKEYSTPNILIGHSLGGAAVLAAASQLPGLQGVVTIAAPSDPAHIEHLFSGSLEEVEAEGEAVVDLSGRKFRIRKEFVDDLKTHALLDTVRGLTQDLLIFHSPTDRIVSIDHAAAIYTAARHPKSFVSLDQADHLLTKAVDAEFVAEVISAWATRILA